MGEKTAAERKRNKGAETVAMWAIAILALLIDFPAAAYVHENAQVWEAAAIFASLGLAILLVLGYLRVRRAGWVVTALASLLLVFSFTAAIFHGWEAQASVLIMVATALAMVLLFVLSARLRHRFESAMRAEGEELSGDPLFRQDTLFRDDGQRITVYPRWHEIVRRSVLQAIILAGIGAALAFIRFDDLMLLIAVMLFAFVAILAFLANIYRLVTHRPALVVGPDGVLDHGSFYWSGVGLIRWDEILAVTPHTRSSSGVKTRYLDILVTDLPGIRRRLPPLKRLAFRTLSFSRMSQVLIAQSLLDRPVGDLAEQIARYVETHAPPGWQEEGAAENGTSLPDHDGRDLGGTNV